MRDRPLLIGCGEWGFRELEISQHFKIAKQFGFHYLEIGIGGGQIGRLPEEMDEREIADFDSLRDSYEIQTPFVCIENDFTLLDAGAHEEMLTRTQSSIRLAAALGGTHVRLFAGFTPAAEMNERLWTQLQDSLVGCAELCSSLGLQIALETHGKITMKGGAAFHEPTVTTDPDSLKRLSAILPPNTGFNYDPGNLKAANPSERTYALPLLNSRINYCHLKDWKPLQGGWTAGAIGDDDLDYAALLPQMDFEGVYLIEYEPTGDVEAGISRSLDYLERSGIPLRFV